jgi:Cys/Met metabolism PLP-dependent enzyme
MWTTAAFGRPFCSLDGARLATTHSSAPVEARTAAGVSEGLIRVSVGLEHPDDLIADLSNALEHCSPYGKTAAAACEKLDVKRIMGR